MYKEMLDPKRSFSERLKKGMQFTVAIGLTVLFLWLLYKVPYKIIREERVRALGETQTSGLVLTRSQSETTSSYETPWYLITYKYVDNDGYTRTARAVMKKPVWDRLEPGSVITVWFANAKPDLVRVEGMVESEMQTMLRGWIND